QLSSCFAAAQRPDNGRSRDQPLAIRRALKRVLQLLIHAMGKAVGGHVAQRVVDGNLSRVELAYRRPQRRRDALVVGGEGVVEAGLAQEQPVRPADDGNAPPAARENERALPGHILAEDQLEGWVGRLGGLTGEGQPTINLPLVKEARRLFELLTQNC